MSQCGARIQTWYPSLPDTQTCVTCCAQSLQSCLTLWDPMDYSPPGSSVHGILLAKILEWVALPSSRGSSWPRDRTQVPWVSCIADRFFTAEPLGKARNSKLLYDEDIDVVCPNCQAIILSSDDEDDCGCDCHCHHNKE